MRAKKREATMAQMRPPDQQGQGATPSRSGSSGDLLTPASVAIWTAISSPLMLISHVLRKSTELNELNTTNATDAAPHAAEFIIERHVQPSPDADPTDEG